MIIKKKKNKYLNNNTMRYSINITDFLEQENIFGFWIYLMGDCIIFSILFVVFLTMFKHSGNSIEIFKNLFSLSDVFIETIILLCSSFTSSIVLFFAGKNIIKSAIFFLLITFLLGLSFIFFEFKEFFYFLHMGYGPTYNGFFSSFFTLLGTHCLHICIGLFWILLLIYQFLKNNSIKKFYNILICFSLFWHFLDIIWIILVPCVYF